MTALERYKSAAQKLADLTRPKCEQCRTVKPTRCCAQEHCMVTAMFMQDYAEHPALKDEIAPLLSRWDEFNHLVERIGPTKDLPFMDEGGCAVPPHLRPVCTQHHCDINALGFFKSDMPATETWFALYERMNETFAELTSDVEA